MVIKQYTEMQHHEVGSKFTTVHAVGSEIITQHSMEGDEANGTDNALIENIQNADTNNEDDMIYQQIEESLHGRRESSSTLSSEADYGVKTSENFTSVPYGFQPRSAYEHFKKNTDIIGIAYNGRMRQFVILDHKGVTTWKKDAIGSQVSRAMNYPRYEYRLITSVLYVRKYNVYFCLGKDFSLKVLNKDFEETCSVSADMRSVLFMIFNPVRDELITGGVGGTKVWRYHRVAEKSWGEIKAMANYRLTLKYALSDVGGSWVKRVEIDLQLQHLYCCSDMDLYVYDMDGNLLFNFISAHTMSITAVVYSPYARLILTTSVDTQMKAWTVAGGLIHTFRGHSRAVTNVALHPDTSSLVITSSLDGSLRLWSLDTMDVLYSVVVSTSGVLWMGLTDDRLLYVGTSRNLTVWSLNMVTQFWALARNKVTKLSLVPGQGKSTRVMAVGDDNSIRIFSRGNQKNLSTVLPPHSISPLQKVRCVSYNRVINVVFLLVDARELWVYTTRTDPSCRIAVWDLLAIQKNCLTMKYENNEGEGASASRPSMNVFGKKVEVHRATEHGQGNEGIADCCCVCYLDSQAIMWTEEGPCCPLRHNYLLFGLEDGRILFMDPVVKGQKYMEFRASKDAIMDLHHDQQHKALITRTNRKAVSHFQIWGLPELELQYEVYCSQDVNCYARMNSTFLTGHECGAVQLHHLVEVDENTSHKHKTVPEIDLSKTEHLSAVTGVDACHNINIYMSCSTDGAIKVWDTQKLLLTEIMLDESLTTACFLNTSADLLVGYLNHVFLIHHSKVCPQANIIGEEEYETESDVYEDPAVLYEGVGEDPDPVNLHNYLVPFDIEFSKDFIEGIKTEAVEEEKEEEDVISESEMSMAPTDIYLSPLSSPRRLSLVDMTLTSDIEKYDLHRHAQHERRESQDSHVIKMPKFGWSPGPSPSPTPPSTPATPSLLSVSEGGESTEEESDREAAEFKPIRPAAATQANLDVVKTQPKAVEPKKGETTDSKSSRLADYRVDAKSLMKTGEAKSSVTMSDKRGSLIKEASHSHGSRADAQSKADSESSGKRSVQKKEAKSVRRMPKRGSRKSHSDSQSVRRPSKLDEKKVEKPRAKGRSSISAITAKTDKSAPVVSDSDDDLDMQTPGVIIKTSKFGHGADGQVGSQHTAAYKAGKKRPIEFHDDARLSLGKSPTAELDPQADRRSGEANLDDNEAGTGGGREMLSKAKPEDQLTQTQQISVEVKQSEETTEPDGVYQETTQQSSKMDSMEFQVKIKTSPIDTSEEKRKGILLQQKKIDERESKDQLKRIVIDTKSSGKVYRDHERLERAGHGRLSTDQSEHRVASRGSHGEDYKRASSAMSMNREDAEDDQTGQRKPRVKSASMLRLKKSSIIPVDAQLQRPARGSSAHHQRSLYNQSPSLYDRISTPGGGDEYLDLTNEAYESFFKDQKNAMDDVAAYKSDFIDRWSAEGRARSRADVDTLLAELLPWGIPNGGWSDTEDDGQKVSDHKGDSQFLSEEERRRCAVRPSSSQPARPNTPADGIQTSVRFRPHSASAATGGHQNLQQKFELALKRYLSKLQASDKLYRNNGMNFEQNWQERMIERHLLLRMQKELRSQNAAQKRHLLELRQKQKRKSLLGHKDCDKARSPPKGSRQDSSSVNTLPRGDRTKAPVTPAPSRATTAGRTRSAISPRVPTVTVTRTTDPSVVTNLTRPQTGASNYSFRHMPVDGTSSSHAHGTFSNLRSSSSQSTSIRPKSAYSKYKEDEDLAASKPFRMRIQSPQQPVSKPVSKSSSSSSGQQVDISWLDPRNPQAVRTPGSKSIPSKCSRYVLVTHPKETPSLPIPTPLEEHLLNERFPSQHQRWLHQLNTEHSFVKQNAIQYAGQQAAFHSF